MNTLVCLVLVSLAQVRYPARPAAHDFILDEADMILPSDEEKIRATAARVLDVKGAPIVVVTIHSLAAYGAAGVIIERYARDLFDRWGIGHANWNHGILLLVSRGDRKARIELGAGWGRAQDAACAAIMIGHIVPHFKAGDTSAGILAGVEGLEKLALGLQVPRGRGAGTGTTMIWIVVGILVVLSLVSVFRTGDGGWGWLLWAAIFGFLALLVTALLASRSRRWGRGWSRSSFGGGGRGGFSGGGGATGSW